MGLKLDVEVGANTRGFATEMEKLKASAAKFSAGLAGNLLAPAAMGAALVSLGREAINAADNIGDLREQTDLLVGQLQTIQRIAKTGGLDTGDIIGALDKMAIARQEALDGNKELAATFAALGISIEQLKATGDRFDLAKLVGKGLPAFSGEDKTNILRPIMGKSGPRLRGAISQLAGANGSPEDLSQGQIDNISRFKDFFEGLKLKNQKKNAASLSWFLGLLGPKQASATTLTPEEKARAAGATGVMPDLKAIKEQGESDKLAAKLAEKNRETAADLDLRELDRKERMAAIESEILRLKKEQVKLNEEGQFLDAEKLRERELKLRGELKASAEDKAGKSISPDSDALARIGLFRGGAADAQIGELRKQNEQLRAANEQLRAIANNTRDMGQ